MKEDALHAAKALKTLQGDYIEAVEAENTDDAEETLRFYVELCEETAKKADLAPKYAKLLVEDASNDFIEAVAVVNGTLLTPLLFIVRAAFERHRPKATSESVLKIYDCLVDHVVEAKEILEEEDEVKDALYDVEEARIIIQVALECVERINVRAAFDRRPEILDLLDSLPFDSLRAKFEAEKEKKAIADARKAAAIVFQARWKAILTQRRWLKMRRGFVQLQRRFRRILAQKRAEKRQSSLLAERRFEETMATIARRRKKAEEEFRRLLNQKPSKTRLFRKSDSDEDEAEDLDPFSQSFFDRESRRHRAAVIIQATARRWLLRRRRRRPVWSRSLLQATALTEAKLKKYADEIALWQQRHKAEAVSAAEQQELHQRAQFQYARFAQTLNRKRLQDHRTLAASAQTEAIYSLVESAPTLKEYDEKLHWADFHSLPFAVATKARLEHKRAMERIRQPKWKRLLQ